MRAAAADGDRVLSWSLEVMMGLGLARWKIERTVVNMVGGCLA